MEHFNPILGHETTGPKFITCGEIMLRLTPPNYEKLRMATNFEASYGGSEANIALAGKPRRGQHLLQRRRTTASAKAPCAGCAPTTSTAPP